MEVEWEFVIEVDEGRELPSREDSGWDAVNFALEDDDEAEVESCRSTGRMRPAHQKIGFSAL